MKQYPARFGLDPKIYDVLISDGAPHWWCILFLIRQGVA